MERKAIYKFQNICKYFPGVKALDDVSFDIMEGEIHAIVGENGAGKSTLMNIISGVYQPSSGSLVFEGERLELKSVSHAQDMGISMIHQELSLSPALDIAENIFAGRLPKGKGGFLNIRKLYAKTEEALKEVGLDYLNAHTLIRDISTSQQQLVEIAKALALKSKLIIMDEPTSSLTASEANFLEEIILGLKKSGVTILYISHKLDEIMRLADKITVLRDGCHIVTDDKSNMTIEKMISYMVGREYSKITVRERFLDDYENRRVILEVEDLCVGNKVKHVGFKLYEGEILGITGLVGAGRSEVLQAVYGADPRRSGTIKVLGKECHLQRTGEAIEQGMGLVPEGRKTQGLFLKLSVQDNASVMYLRKLRSKVGLLNTRKCRSLTEQYIKKLNIKTPSQGQLIENLSGGNQQKVVIARCLMNHPKILFMDEPTQGIDVGAKEEIYQIMNELVKEGVSIVMVSSEMQETISLCDRVLVMYEGQITGELIHKDVSDEKILALASNKGE